MLDSCVVAARPPPCLIPRCAMRRSNAVRVVCRRLSTTVLFVMPPVLWLPASQAEVDIPRFRVHTPGGREGGREGERERAPQRVMCAVLPLSHALASCTRIWGVGGRGRGGQRSV